MRLTNEMLKSLYLHINNHTNSYNTIDLLMLNLYLHIHIHHFAVVEIERAYGNITVGAKNHLR